MAEALMKVLCVLNAQGQGLAIMCYCTQAYTQVAGKCCGLLQDTFIPISYATKKSKTPSWKVLWSSYFLHLDSWHLKLWANRNLNHKLIGLLHKMVGVEWLGIIL